MSRNRSQPGQNPVEPLFDDWHRNAVSLINPTHALRIGRIPHRQWTQWYIRRLTAEEAAKEAERVIWNAMSAGERLRLNLD